MVGDKAESIAQCVNPAVGQELQRKEEKAKEEIGEHSGGKI
jgi:hypothetical protein